MRLYRIRRKQLLPIDIDVAWNFFSNPANLAKITPAWLDFTVTSELPLQIYAGQLISYTITPFPGMTRKWLTEITVVNPPNLFVDEQRFGPYRFWHHQHFFKKVAGGTEVIDLVNYMLPFGWLGLVAHHVYIRKKLDEIFSFRQKVLEQEFQV